MATVAEFTIPADEFPLGRVFEEFPEVTVELERVVPTGDAAVPYFWVHGSDDASAEEIDAAFRQPPQVSAVQSVDELDGSFLKRVTWTSEYEGVLRSIVETGVVLVSGVGTEENWTFEVRSEGRDEIAAFRADCRERGVPVEVSSLHALASVQGDRQYDLTDTQREALVLAFRSGYFDSPRGAKLEGIAEELGISRQSLASRLRRGHCRLIENVLVNP